MTQKIKKSEETQEKILEAALKLFSEQGYASTPTSQIAQEAQVAEGTIFKYFPKKMDLLRKTLYKFVEKYSTHIVFSPLEKIFDEHKNVKPEVLFKAIIMDRIALLEKMGPFLSVLLTEMQYHEELRQIFIENVLYSGIDYGERVMTHFKEEGYFREIPSLIAFRSFLGSIGLMILQRKFLSKTSVEGMSLDEEIDWVIDLFLNGLSKKGV